MGRFGRFGAGAGKGCTLCQRRQRAICRIPRYALLYMRGCAQMKEQKNRFGASVELGARLRSLRRAARLTQAGLARLVGSGWDQALVSRLESG
jgi:hypothetical protein